MSIRNHIKIYVKWVDAIHDFIIYSIRDGTHTVPLSYIAFSWTAKFHLNDNNSNNEMTMWQFVDCTDNNLIWAIDNINNPYWHATNLSINSDSIFSTDCITLVCCDSCGKLLETIFLLNNISNLYASATVVFLLQLDVALPLTKLLVVTI